MTGDKGSTGTGVNTNKASDLVDGRGGAKDSIVNPKPIERPTAHEKAQHGADVRPETTPGDQTQKTVYVRDPAAVERFKQGKEE